MQRRTLALGIGALPFTGLAGAQTADGPLRIVVPYPPGGATDKVARIVGDKLQATLGVPVVVDNRTGAGGRLAAQQLKGSPPNQNAILLANHGPVVSGRTLSSAADAIEELEATARLWLLVRGERVRALGADEVAEIDRRFPH